MRHKEYSSHRAQNHNYHAHQSDCQLIHLCAAKSAGISLYNFQEIKITYFADVIHFLLLQNTSTNTAQGIGFADNISQMMLCSLYTQLYQSVYISMANDI